MKKQIIIILVVISIISGIICFYQTQKKGLHEDEGFTLASAVNPNNGLMTAYEHNDIPENENPVWKTKEQVRNYMTLTSENYLNLKAVYLNQAYDNHPPFFYLLVHFSSMLFSGNFSMYTAFVVNFAGFLLSCWIIIKILKLLDKQNLTIATLLLYGLSMGTISMVVYQRMYMWLTTFILLYFYYSVKIYKSGFEIDKNMIMKLGITTLLGFWTQYYFAVYAALIFVLMIIKMKKDNKQDKIKKYVVAHLVYAAIGILVFPPCINHLLFSSRGISNLGNGNYFGHFIEYLKQLAYAFTVKDNMIVIIGTLLVLAVATVYAYKKSNEKFILGLLTIPGVIFFLITVKMTSFQELRYIMPVIPFVVLTVFFILNQLLQVKYKNVFMIGFAVILVAIGMIFSEPKFLYKNYGDMLKIANENSDKSFVYVYDNFFNHMQSIPEMMTYKKTLIINKSKDELNYLVQDEQLKNEDSYILCIKSYMNQDEVLEKIKNETDFKDIKALYTTDTNNASMCVQNNLYLVTKNFS